MTGHKTLAAAMVAAQGEMSNATINAKNPHFKNEYADLPAVIAAVVPALNSNGVHMSQPTCYEGETLVVKTMFTHAASGESECAVLPIPSTGKMQDIGSAITYARRYTLSCLAGIGTEKDDDGQSAAPVSKPETNSAGRPKADPTKSWTIPVNDGDFDDFIKRFCNGLKQMDDLDHINKLCRDNNETIVSLGLLDSKKLDYINNQCDARRHFLANKP